MLMGQVNLCFFSLLVALELDLSISHFPIMSTHQCELTCKLIHIYCMSRGQLKKLKMYYSMVHIKSLPSIPTSLIPHPFSFFNHHPLLHSQTILHHYLKCKLFVNRKPPFSGTRSSNPCIILQLQTTTSPQNQRYRKIRGGVLASKPRRISPLSVSQHQISCLDFSIVVVETRK